MGRSSVCFRSGMPSDDLRGFVARGEENKDVLREYASLEKNFLRIKAKMCFSFNLSFRCKPRAGLRRTTSIPTTGGWLNRAYSND
jgi:hypothetical protein